MEANWAGELNLELILCLISLLGRCPAGSLSLSSLGLRACGPTVSSYAICLDEGKLQNTYQASRWHCKPQQAARSQDLAYLDWIARTLLLAHLSLQVTPRGANQAPQVLRCVKGRLCIVSERILSSHLDAAT